MPDPAVPLRQRNLRATPTLAGLRVTQRQDGFPEEAVPWTRVGLLRWGGLLSPAGWLVYDKLGNLIRIDGRPLMLEVPVLRAARLANRLHCRAVRRAWRAGTYAHATSFAPRARCPWPLLLVGAAVMLLFGLGTIQGGPWTGDLDPLLTAPQRLLVHVLAVNWLLLCTGPFLLLAWIAWSHSRRPNVTAARFDAKGLSARLLDGTETRVPWDSVLKTRWLGGLAELRFADRPPLWLRLQPLDRRTRLVLKLAARPDASDAELLGRGLPPDVLRRCLWYCVLGATGGFALAWLAVPDQRHLAWVPSLIMLALGLMIVLLERLPRFTERLERRRRSRKRRARHGGHANVPLFLRRIIRVHPWFDFNRE